MSPSDSAKPMEELIEQIRSGKIGEEAGFLEVFHQTDPYIRRVIRSTAHNSEVELEDIAGAVWVTIWERIDTFDPDKASFRTWVSNIARNKTIDHWRRQMADPIQESLDAPEGLSVKFDQTDDTFERVSDKELANSVLTALMKLSDFERTLYLMHITFGTSFGDLAIVASRAGVKMTSKAVEHRIYRIRHKLRKLLEQGDA